MLPEWERAIDGWPILPARKRRSDAAGIGKGTSVVAVTPENTGQPQQQGELTAAQLARGFTLLGITTFLATIMINIPQTISPNFFRDEI